jgi:hypothetical protein
MMRRLNDGYAGADGDGVGANMELKEWYGWCCRLQMQCEQYNIMLTQAYKS